MSGKKNSTKLVSLDSTVVVSCEQVSCDLGGEQAILSLKKGIYYGLDSVGARIWNLAQKPVRVRDILRILLSEYEVEPARCKQDLLNLLGSLLSEDLMEVIHEPSG